MQVREGCNRSGGAAPGPGGGLHQVRRGWGGSEGASLGKWEAQEAGPGIRAGGMKRVQGPAPGTSGMHHVTGYSIS
jgi:hypothetical protein